MTFPIATTLPTTCNPLVCDKPSSLSYLKRKQVSELKINRSFVIGMTQATDDEFIVCSNIALGCNMGLVVVAEGVEDEATLDKLRALGCEMAQGYYIGHPVAADKISTWLAHWKQKSASIA